MGGFLRIVLHFPSSRDVCIYVCIGTIVMDNTARNSISLIKRIPSPAASRDSRRSLHNEAHTSSQIRQSDKSRVNHPRPTPSCKKNRRNQSYSGEDTWSMRRKILEIIAINLIAFVEKKLFRGIELSEVAMYIYLTNAANIVSNDQVLIGNIISISQEISIYLKFICIKKLIGKL